MHVTAFARCGYCHGLKLPKFYQGKRVARCGGCEPDYRTPVEVRRDAVLDKYGNDPDAYTPAVLAELTKDGLFDITASFCPAGRLTMAEARAREAEAIAAATGTAETSETSAQCEASQSGGKAASPNPSRQDTSPSSKDETI